MTCLPAVGVSRRPGQNHQVPSLEFLDLGAMSVSLVVEAVRHKPERAAGHQVHTTRKCGADPGRTFCYTNASLHEVSDYSSGRWTSLWAPEAMSVS